MPLPKTNIIILGLLMTIATVAVLVNPAKAAPCSAPSTDRGSVTSTVNVSQAGTYHAWSLLKTGTANTDNSYLLEVDGNDCYVVGDNNGISTSAWSWIDYQNGSTSAKINLTLTAGNHTFKMIGREQAVKLDKILLLTDSCTPTGLGTNCTAAASTTSPLYRLYAPSVNYHFWTASAAERDWLTITRGDFVLEGNSGKVSSSSAPGLTPLYRLYAPSVNKHFWTTSSAEKDWLAITRGDFNYEGITGYVSAAAGNGLTPLYRLYAPSANKHFWTTNSAERDWLAITRGDFNSEGTTGFVGSDGFTPGSHTVFEAEIGTVTTPAAKVSSSSASGGEYVNFVDGVSPPCALPAYPDESCTGVPTGTVLTVPSVDEDGNLELNTANQTVTAVNIPGCLVIRAPGITVRNSRMRCVAMVDGPATNPANTRFTLEDSEVDCDRDVVTDTGPSTGIFYENYTIRRVEIQDCENGLDMYRNATLEDSLVWKLEHCKTEDCIEPDAHTDGIQSGDGSNVSIIHNRIEVWNRPCSPGPGGGGGMCNGTGAVNINHNAGFAGTISNTLIQYNLLSGGSVTMYCPSVPSIVNYRILDNHFSTEYSPDVGAYGPSTACDDEIKSGNVYHESGLPITLD